jgi:hypothetical protein
MRASADELIRLNEEIQRISNENVRLSQLLQLVAQSASREIVVRTYLSGDTATTLGEANGGYMERYIK